MADASALVPRDKFDLAAGERAVAAGWPAVEPVLKDLVSWCLDGNWPVAAILAPFLGQLGVPVVPAVLEVLDSDDAPAKSCILFGIGRTMPAEAIDALTPHLLKLRDHPSSDEVKEELPQLAAELLRG
jgi:HEAT repeat protein